MAGRKRFDVQTLHATAWIRAAGVGVLILSVFVWAALPVSLAAWGRKAPNPARDAMTVGCAEASCCTSRCYLDKNGIHHCVPIEGGSCECGLSSRPTVSTFAFSQDLQIPPESSDDFSCTLPLAGFLSPAKTTLNRTDLSVPTPPPR